MNKSACVKRPRGSTTWAVKAGVGSTPRKDTSRDMLGVVRTPKEFVPLLRPDGPFYGSGV
jgi:hypothetical protein